MVILGDHLGMPGDLSDRLERAGPRFVYNRILNPATLSASRQTVNHFDMFPTLLAAMGFRVEGGRAALGCSALGPANCQSLALDPLADDKLRRSSPFYNGLWQPVHPHDLLPHEVAAANQRAS